MRGAGLRTRAGEAEAGVVLEGLGVGLAVETPSCHVVARTRGRGGGEAGRAVVSDSLLGLARGRGRRLWPCAVGNGANINERWRGEERDGVRVGN